MFKTIVWATDGSDQADSALPIVTELARIHDARIVVLHVDTSAHIAGLDVGQDVDARVSDLSHRLDAQVERLRMRGFQAELKIIPKPHRARAGSIAEAAAGIDADLIVVGTHGYGGLEAFVHGSVARGLTHEAGCPVLVVPPAAASRLDALAGLEAGHHGPPPLTQVDSM